jgi:hypothetical protein
MRRIAIVHQPYFLPWMGYFNKLAHATDFVVLDDVQYRPRYYHNRAAMKDHAGERAWLTFPVHHHHRSLLRDVETIPSNLSAILKTLQRTYGRAPHFGTHWTPIASALQHRGNSLVELNVTLMAILELPSVRFWYSTQVTSTKDPTERLIHCCKAVGANTLIMGEGGSLECHDLDRLRSAGLSLEIQRYASKHPVYPQGKGSFIGGLSAADAIFRVGAQRTRQMILDGWRPSWTRASFDEAEQCDN